MQPQNNDFPLDKISSSPTGAAGSADPGQAASAAAEPVDNPMVGGTTFTPQSAPANVPAPSTAPPESPLPTPSWQQDAQNDASQVYAADQPGNPAVAQSTPPVAPEAAMSQDFSTSANPGAPTPPPNPAEPPVFEPPVTPPPTTPAPPTPEPLSPIESQPASPAAPPVSESTLTPQPNPAPAPSANTLDLSNVAGAQPASPPPHVPDVHPAEPAGLPGAEQLSAASAGLDQNQPPSPDPMMDPMLADSTNMGSYGPPPNNKKKLILIILGVVLGLVLIGVLILILTRSTAKKPAVNLSQEQPQQQQQPEQVTQPTSGPATPPQGYVTIEKQCYSFAMYEKNTVPTDQVCSFANATFGKLGVSKVSVATGTETYNSLDDFVGKVKPTLSVTNDEPIKLDGFDARKITYKASDAKTYVKVLTLVTGKNYQQDGKKVTNVEITSSYGEDFDKQVTNTMIDTWRWK